MIDKADQMSTIGNLSQPSSQINTAQAPSEIEVEQSRRRCSLIRIKFVIRHCHAFAGAGKPLRQRSVTRLIADILAWGTPGSFVTENDAITVEWQGISPAIYRATCAACGFEIPEKEVARAVKKAISRRRMFARRAGLSLDYPWAWNSRIGTIFRGAQVTIWAEKSEGSVKPQ
jgi:hypothetical protein